MFKCQHQSQYSRSGAPSINMSILFLYKLNAANQPASVFTVHCSLFIYSIEFRIE